VTDVDVRHWRPHPGPQTRALKVLVDELLYGGSRGGAKTEAGIVRCGAGAVGPRANPRYRALVIRLNYTDMGDWVDRAMKHYRPYGACRSGNEIRFPNGAIIRMGHLADKDAYQKYQGHEYQFLLLEEATQIPREEDYEKLLGSVRSSDPTMSPMAFLTANPGGPGHGWVKKRFITPAAPGTAFPVRVVIDHPDGSQEVLWRWRMYIPARLSDNPSLSNNYLASLGAMSDALKRAWLGGDWDALSGQYFHEWDQNIHVCRPFKMPAHWPRYMAADWGYWPDPSACLWIAVDEIGRAYVYREKLGHRETPEELGKTWRSLMVTGEKEEDVVADPSMWARKDGPDSHAERLELAGFRMVRGIHERAQGWMRVHEYLRNAHDGKPWLQVFSNCRNLIEAIPELMHDKKDPMDAAEHPSDHLPDALRYFLMSRPLPSEPPPPAEPANPRTKAAMEHRKRVFAKFKR